MSLTYWPMVLLSTKHWLSNYLSPAMPGSHWVSQGTPGEWSDHATHRGGLSPACLHLTLKSPAAVLTLKAQLQG